MKRKKKFEKISEKDLAKIRDRKTKDLVCKCGRLVEGVSVDAEEILCHICTTQLVPIKPKQVNPKSGFPRGWKLWGEYVHSDGTVYHKGIEQPQLKGKLPPTDVAAWKEKNRKNKKTKKEKEALREAKLVKKFKKKKELKKKEKKAKEKKLKELAGE